MSKASLYDRSLNAAIKIVNRAQSGDHKAVVIGYATFTILALLRGRKRKLRRPV